MIEPWDLDWAGVADWGNLPRFDPTIPALMARARLVHPGSEVLVIDDERLTYGELERRSALLARQLLAAGVGKGCRIGVMLPNDASFLVTWTAVTRIGAVAVCLPTLAKPPEIVKIVRHGDVHLLFAPRRYLHHDYAERLEQAFPDMPAVDGPMRRGDAPMLRGINLWCAAGEDCPSWAARVSLDVACDVDEDLLAAVEASVHPSDAAGIIYTSGSTAEPKGVIHSHGNFVRQALKLAACFDYRADERAFATMPFFWVGGLTTTMLTLMAVGGTILATRQTGEALLDFVERERTTTVVTWPHILQTMAESPTFAARDWGAMRNGLFYEALPPDRRPVDKSLMTTPIGMTEVNGPYAVIDRALPPGQRGSVGRLMPGVAARLVDRETGASIAEFAAGDRKADSQGRVGEIQLRSDVMMLGMVKREQAEVFHDGWFPTGDLGSFSEGHIHYHGRCDDMIKAQGSNVSPREVEAVLVALAGVASAHVFGVQDGAKRTVVAAAVVAAPGAALAADELRKRAAESLASYKVPRIVRIYAAGELPMLPNSKLDRLTLVRQLEAAC